MLNYTYYREQTLDSNDIVVPKMMNGSFSIQVVSCKMYILLTYVMLGRAAMNMTIRFGMKLKTLQRAVKGRETKRIVRLVHNVHRNE